MFHLEFLKVNIKIVNEINPQKYDALFDNFTVLYLKSISCVEIMICLNFY